MDGIKTIDLKKVEETLTSKIDYALKHVDSGAMRLINSAYGREPASASKWAYKKIIDNDTIACASDSYSCQDTGLAVFFIELGQDVRLINGQLDDSLHQAVRSAYRHARKSVAHPLTRLNTGDNTPALIHTSIIPGNALKVSFMAKGAGSENMTRLYMLTPSKGEEGILDCVIDAVTSAGSNPCPPVFIGVGIGGTAETACLLSKKALLRDAGSPSTDGDCARLEREILEKVNSLGLGAQGYPGKTYALSCAAMTTYTHIGMLPVAVNLQCHSLRKFEIEF